MSKTLQNILTTFSKMEALPKKPFVSCGFLQLLFKNLDNFDTAQRKYFCDEKAGRIFDWVLQNNLLMTLYENPAPEILDNIPYPKNVWDSITQKALNMPPVVAEDYLLDRINTWLLESYAVKGRCEAKPGDIVLDCGTYTGNTSVYFSQKVGTSGHVYGFEPGPATFKIYSENVAPYNNITPINAGLTDKSKIIDGFTTMGFSGDHPGAAFSTAGEVQVPVTAIDIFCGERKIPRVDFIKMDVEGAESDVLQGAAATICAHRPQMAISAYHKWNDLFELPKLISTICPGYQFTLRHFSDSSFETVMFCTHSDQENYFGAGVATEKIVADSGQIYEQILSLMLPYVEEALLDKRYENKIEEIREIKDLGEYAMGISGQAEKLVAMNEHLARENSRLAHENVALRRILERK